MARGLVDWTLICNVMEKATRDLRLTAQHARPGSRLRWAEPIPDDIETASWLTAMAQLQVALNAAQTAVDTVSEIAPDFVRLHERINMQLALIDHFQEACAEGSVRWLEVGSQLRLVESPLDISMAVQTLMLNRTPEELHKISSHENSVSTDSNTSSRSWIFTSATLGEDEQMKWFTEPCGLSHAQKLRVASPFDYESKSAIYVPKSMPKPNDATHTRAVAAWVEKYARQLGGRTLVLTTTLNAMRTIGEALTAALGQTGELEVLVQGQGPKRRLMERFREGAQQGGMGCILVASASFWEGFDVPGDALQLVVIDKLPFPPPNDPLVEARSQRLECLGKSSFSDYSLPEAAVALKQGAGRLIRSENDRGLLVVCDPRLTGMSYGKRLMSSLPPMRRIENELDFEAAVLELTKTSTMNPIS
jgi:ATP-dependent DNA helicase DinG